MTGYNEKKTKGTKENFLSTIEGESAYNLKDIETTAQLNNDQIRFIKSINLFQVWKVNQAS